MISRILGYILMGGCLVSGELAAALADTVHEETTPNGPGNVDSRLQLQDPSHWEGASALQEAALPMRWYLHTGFINAYPKLESERLIRDLFNPAMRLLAPSFDNVTTVGTLRDRGLLFQPQIGLGYVLSDKWTWTFQTGWIEGKVRTQAKNRSIFLGLPLDTDFEIKRSAAFLGTGVDYYPFGMPLQQDYGGWGERFRASKPYLGASVTATYATYRARVKLAFPPISNIGIVLTDQWLVYNLNVHGGWELPYNARNSLLVNVGVNRFDRQRHDFEGLAISVEWKHLFRWRGKN